MLLEGKKGLIVGIANRWSLAWGIAKSVSREGARLAVTYQGERLERNVRELAKDLEKPLILPCDVTRDEEMDGLAEAVKNEFGRLDFMIHAVAFALREELAGAFVDTSPSYSLTALARRMEPLTEGKGGSIVTLSYIGGARVIPNYNVMGVAKAALEMSVRYLAADLGPKGIRVNAISAGPIKTLASSGVHGISKMLEYHRNHTPLRKNTEQAEVGDTAVFLVSRLSRGITGEILHVDNGFHIMGMSAL